jgi:hypothetical protein
MNQPKQHNMGKLSIGQIAEAIVHSARIMLVTATIGNMGHSKSGKTAPFRACQRARPR